MFAKRIKGYKSMGYIMEGNKDKGNSEQMKFFNLLGLVRSFPYVTNESRLVF
jgi:hypothetical protein